MKDVAEKSPTPKVPGAKLLMVVSPYYRGIADMMQPIDGWREFKP